MMRRLFEGRLDPRSARFSYSLGIVSHYVCDYFCYPHHPSFKGGLREHIAYETRQRPEPEDPRFSPAPGGGETNFRDMTESLDRHLSSHHRRRPRRGGSRDDIGPAIHAAARLNAAICFSAERLYYPGILPYPQTKVPWRKSPILERQIFANLPYSRGLYFSSSYLKKAFKSLVKAI
jgi:hypothetical protein